MNCFVNLGCFALVSFFITANGGFLNGRVRAPSIFRADESELHKYSAVLAASEPVRLQSEKQIKNSISLFQYFVLSWRGQPILKQVEFLRPNNKGVDLACERYETGVQNILKSYGLKVNDFNTISKHINEQPSLKNKVLQQSYYYKIAADLDFNLNPSLYSGTSKFSSLKHYSYDAHSRIGSVDESDVEETQMSRFVRALRAVESARLKTRDMIKSELNVRELPPVIADPRIQHAMSPLIQRAVQHFPLTAAHIIEQNGLYVAEFNALHRKLNSNPVYRYMVCRQLKNLK